MRITFILFLFIMTNIATAEISPLLKCLAREEQLFHQAKIQGPFYKLNQKMLLMISQFPKLMTQDTVLKDVCQAKQSEHPSMLLLEHFLLNSTKIFKIDPDVESEQVALLNNTLDEMRNGLPELLIGFLADLQSTLETANCLNKEVKEAAYFTDRFKYLQSVVDHQELFENKSKVRQLFSQLKNWPAIEKACRAAKIKQNN